MDDGAARLTRVRVWTAIFLAAGLVLWEVAARNSSFASFFFSSPSDVFRAIIAGAVSGTAKSDILASMAATILGLLIGATAGVLIGIMGLGSPALKGVFGSSVAVIGALPILAIAPMFMIWFGTGLSLKIALGSVLAGLVFAGRTLNLAASIGAPLMEFAQANRIPASCQATKMTVPLGASWILAEVPAATNASFLGVFVGEFIAADRGIGYRILRSGALYQVDVVLAYSALAILSLLLLQMVLALASRRISRFVEVLSVDPALRDPAPRGRTDS